MAGARAAECSSGERKKHREKKMAGKENTPIFLSPIFFSPRESEEVGAQVKPQLENRDLERQQNHPVRRPKTPSALGLAPQSAAQE
jgi:hypothetical protein